VVRICRSVVDGDDALTQRAVPRSIDVTADPDALDRITQ